MEYDDAWGSMTEQTIDLWKLVRKRPQIDPGDLAEAICAEADRIDLDYRSRLLVRDSVNALRSCWGEARFDSWLARCPARERINIICSERFDEVGYPSLQRRLMEKIDPDEIRQFFEELGKNLRHEL